MGSKINTLNKSFQLKSYFLSNAGLDTQKKERENGGLIHAMFRNPFFFFSKKN